VLDASIRFLSILRALAAREVDFILIGGVAAVTRGVPITTMDIDIVHAAHGIGKREFKIQRLMESL
jgi:hypothetical protein